jgi:predicted MFS family arabinose efflux permease
MRSVLTYLQELRQSERAILFLVGAVQFVNILDFMMVMPLGPDFAKSLGIPLSSIGLVGGAYTASAAIAGFAGAFFLDRFDRRTALGVALVGLVVGTAAGGLAVGLSSLMAARVIAGAFGGPASSLALSIVADVVPAERRGKALGAVMSAFSVSSVLGVPAGLELARLGGWRTPFFVVAALGLLITIRAVVLLPPLRGHLQRMDEHPPLRALVARPVVRASYAVTAATMVAGFLLIPNMSSFIQGNQHYPRERLGFLYLVGGGLTFGTMRLAGRLVDRHGVMPVAAGATLALVVITGAWIGFPTSPIPVVVLFAAFMVANSSRNVAYNALVTRVPKPEERARFMSIQSTVQHLSGAAGAGISASLLSESPDGALIGLGTVAALSATLSLMVPVLMARVLGQL